MAKSPCKDRRVVHVDNRLHSFEYDNAWYETGPASAMCYWSMCNHLAYNDWLRETNKYIYDDLKPHYTEVRARTQAISGGSALPMNLSDRFKQIDDFIKRWESENFKSARPADVFIHPTPMYWMGKIQEVVKYFDKAACYVADLNDIADNAISSPGLSKRSTPPSVKEPPGKGDSWLGNPAGGSSEGGSVSGGTALNIVGLVAIGAAGYFGFKVLTE